MNKMLFKLQGAKNAIDSVIEQIKTTQDADIEDLHDLLKACEVIDEKYKEMCQEYDEEDGLEPGTTYKDGISIEFYIEADWWHDISVCLRRIQQSV